MSRIVVGVDGSAHADRALQWAVHEAELRAATVELVHGYVINTRFAMFGTSDRERAQATMDEIVGRNQALLDRTKWSTTVVSVITGRPVWRSGLRMVAIGGGAAAVTYLIGSLVGINLD